MVCGLDGKIKRPVQSPINSWRGRNRRAVSSLLLTGSFVPRGSRLTPGTESFISLGWRSKLSLGQFSSTSRRRRCGRAPIKETRLSTTNAVAQLLTTLVAVGRGVLHHRQIRCQILAGMDRTHDAVRRRLWSCTVRLPPRRAQGQAHADGPCVWAQHVQKFAAAAQSEALRGRQRQRRCDELAFVDE